jgi:prepilin-type N-terminal cleavage/methylation domain-containing protein/prepilin-type processing-associated H-X9-DG protein
MAVDTQFDTMNIKSNGKSRLTALPRRDVLAFEAAKGFTLLELLVTIGIIGLLAALILSALSQAKQKAMAVACAGNVHQINLAVSMYCQNNESYYPWTWTGTEAGHGLCWFNYIRPYLPNTNSILCPTKEQTRKPPPTHIFADDGTVSDYAANYQIGGHDAPVFPSIRARKDASLARPASTVYVVDAGSQPTNTANPNQCVTTSSPQKAQCWVMDDPGGPYSGLVCAPSRLDDNWCGPSIRHSARCNVGFLDGHNEKMNAQWYYRGTPWLQPMLGGGG